MEAAVKVSVEEIRAGDEFWHEGELQWRAITGAHTEKIATSVDIQVFPDGGLTTRTWARGTVLPIMKAAA